MKWYDFFAGFYDSSLEKLYSGSRKRAVEVAGLKDGQTVMDVACGTGANFGPLKASGKKIILYGTDYSDGMLKKAAAAIAKNNWKDIHLFQADARTLTPSSIEKHTNKKMGFDRIICVLGLSVIPEWETVLDNLVALLNDNGKIVIVDVFAERRTFHTWLVEKIARADLNREIAQTLKKKTDHFHQEYLPVKETKVGGKLFVATGTKPGR